jgi:16S rRNA G527 N7-methylase RsmG
MSGIERKRMERFARFVEALDKINGQKNLTKGQKFDRIMVEHKRLKEDLWALMKMEASEE